MSFLGLGLAAVVILLLATLAVIVFLYWLKPPPQRVVVPSTLIWSRVLKERARRSDFWRWLISLLLALAIGLSLAMSLGRPEIEESERPRRMAIVLDNSATMGAMTSTGQTRWELAVAHAEAILDAGSASGEYLVTDTAGQVLATAYTSRKAAREQLASLQLSLGGRVRFPDGGPLRPTPPGAPGGTQVYFISDEVMVQEVPDGVSVVSVFEHADNVGITAFDLRPLPALPNRHEAFLELVNHSNERKRVVLQVDGTAGKVISSAVVLEPGQVLGENLDLGDFPSGPVRALIDAPGDGLAADNLAYTYLSSPQRVQVLLVTPGNDYLSTVLRADPRVRLTISTPEDYSAETPADLLILDRFAPPARPSMPVLAFRPSSVEWLPARSGSDLEELSLAGVRSRHPLLAHVSLADVVVDSAVGIEPGDATLVAGTPQQPIIVAGEMPRRWAEVTFALSDSNLPLQSGFPIFVSNAVDWLTGVDVESVPLGTIRVAATEALVTDLDGNEIAVHPSGEQLAFTPSAPGLFSVRTRERQWVVAANLLNPGASAVNQTAHSDSAESMGPTPESSGLFANELWLILLGLALALVLIEWWTYNRRVTV